MKNGIKNLAKFLVALLCAMGSMSAWSAPGDLLATVTLPGNGSAVGGVMIPLPGGGQAYASPRGLRGSIIDIYAPPAGLGAQVATLIATKTVANGDGIYGCITWDSSRSQLWGAGGGGGSVYSLDLGDPTVSGPVTAVLEFSHGVSGIGLCDGIAYDSSSDTIWLSPDVDSSVYEFGLGGANPEGVLLNTISPQSAGAVADGLVSGVEIGANNSLYIARNGAREIRRVSKSTGAFISNFSQTVGRAEDLSCDSVTYAPLSAMIAKEFDFPGYEVFEVDPDTCEGGIIEPPPVDPDAEPVPLMNRFGLVILALMLGMAGLWAQRRFNAPRP